VPSALRRLIEAFEPAPAYVLGPRWEFAAWNAAEARLYPAITTLQPPERNLLWVLFADPATRGLIVDWDIHARQALAEFRAATATRRGDVELVELVEKLSASSDAFAEWWPEHDVAGFETRLRRFRHPAAGLPTFELTADTTVAVADRGGAPVPATTPPGAWPSATTLTLHAHSLAALASFGRVDERLRRTVSGGGEQARPAAAPGAPGPRRRPPAGAFDTPPEIL
jgi:hypothetical protein